MNDYIQYYGLSENPFDISPDPKSFFPSESHKEALASLLYVVKERKGFMLLIGEEGAGKTILVNHLIKSLDNNENVVYFSDGNLSYEQILKELLIKLKLSPKRINKAAMLFELNDYLIQNLALGKNLILIIDEAQNISGDVLEELRLTSNLETSSSKLLQIIFVGRPKLETKLNTRGLRQLKQRIGTIGRINRLSPAESIKYINHRLLHAGCDSSDIFSPKALALICSHSDGIPIKVNLLCHNALFKGFEYSEKPILAKTIRKIRNKGYLLEDKQIKDAVTGHKQKPLFTFAKRKVCLKRSLYFCLAIGCIMVAVFLGNKHLNNIPEISKPLTYFKPTTVSKKVPKKVEIKAPVTKEVISDATVIWEVLVPEPLPVIPLMENQPEQNTSDISDNSDTADTANTADTADLIDPPNVPETNGLRYEKIVTINEGDTLYLLILNNYNLANTTLMDIVIAFNSEIPNPDLIFLNSKIRMPEITESNLIKKSSDGSIKAHLGTFLTRQKAVNYKRLINITDKEIEIIPITVSPGKTWFRVMAGPFTNEEDCLKMVQELRQKGLLPAFG
ncbi:MAG: AAA family ATPase [Proteobacteria bacterium]|nr:AAA family ATPase [Pseudomonadota bacterium]